MPVLNHFDLLAPIYDRFIHPVHPTQLLDLLNLPLNGTVLDAGGGTGRIAQFMSAPTRRVILADLSHGMLCHASRIDGIFRICSDTGRLPFPDSIFDRIIMVDALHHIFDQPATAAELWRSVKPGGILVIEEPDIRSISVKWIAFIEKITLMHSHFLPPSDIARLFTHADLIIQLFTESHSAWIKLTKQPVENHQFHEL